MINGRELVRKEEDSNNKYALLLKENSKLQERLKNYTNIQQKLISANYVIDKQLESYKKINAYTKLLVEARTIKVFKSIIPDAVVDIFSSESAMVVFKTPQFLTIHSEGLEKNEFNVDNIYRAVENIILNNKERKPVYLSRKDIDNHPSIENFERILVRKFHSQEEDYTFFILGMVSKKHAKSFDLLNSEELIIFDNFSEQMYAVLKHKIYKENLITEKEKYRSIIANMQLGLLEVDNDEKILMANQTFCKMSGYSEEELIGKNAIDTFLDDDARLQMLKQNHNRRKNKSSIYEIEFTKKNGEKRNWVISGAPNYNIHKEVVGSIGIHFDITEQKVLENNLLESNIELKKINSELDTFVYRVSHDLRTPVVSIIGLIDLIKSHVEGGICERNKEYFTLMSESANRLDNTIQDILYYSRNSRIELDIKPINIQLLITEIFNDLKHLNDNDLVFETDFNYISFIDSDKTRIETVLKNILSNAVKYLKPNSKKSIIKFCITEGKTSYNISISDNGIGIAKDHLEKIFEMFFRGTSQSFGTGLGLYIVKESINKLNGKIKVASNLNEGTKFIIKLPKKYN
jgi:PAS domain S-box-containing protein